MQHYHATTSCGRTLPFYSPKSGFADSPNEKEGIISATDDLLAPVHYPFPLRGYVLEEMVERVYIHLWDRGSRSEVQSSPFRVIFFSLTLLVGRFRFSLNPEPLNSEPVNAY